MADEFDTRVIGNATTREHTRYLVDDSRIGGRVVMVYIFDILFSKVLTYKMEEKQSLLLP